MAVCGVVYVVLAVWDAHGILLLEILVCVAEVKVDCLYTAMQNHNQVC
jgi:hypothetical protein